MKFHEFFIFIFLTCVVYTRNEFVVLFRSFYHRCGRTSPTAQILKYTFYIQARQYHVYFTDGSWKTYLFIHNITTFVCFVTNTKRFLSIRNVKNMVIRVSRMSIFEIAYNVKRQKLFVQRVYSLNLQAYVCIKGISRGDWGNWSHPPQISGSYKFLFKIPRFFRYVGRSQ